MPHDIDAKFSISFPFWTICSFRARHHLKCHIAVMPPTLKYRTTKTQSTMGRQDLNRIRLPVTTSSNPSVPLLSFQRKLTEVHNWFIYLEGRPSCMRFANWLIVICTIDVSSAATHSTCPYVPRENFSCDTLYIFFLFLCYSNRNTLKAMDIWIYFSPQIKGNWSKAYIT